MSDALNRLLAGQYYTIKLSEWKSFIDSYPKNPELMRPILFRYVYANMPYDLLYYYLHTNRTNQNPEIEQLAVNRRQDGDFFYDSLTGNDSENHEWYYDLLDLPIDRLTLFLQSKNIEIPVPRILRYLEQVPVDCPAPVIQAFLQACPAVATPYYSDVDIPSYLALHRWRANTCYAADYYNTVMRILERGNLSFIEQACLKTFGFYSDPAFLTHVKEYYCTSDVTGVSQIPLLRLLDSDVGIPELSTYYIQLREALRLLTVENYSLANIALLYGTVEPWCIDGANQQREIETANSNSIQRQFQRLLYRVEAFSACPTFKAAFQADPQAVDYLLAAAAKGLDTLGLAKIIDPGNPELIVKLYEASSERIKTDAAYQKRVAQALYDLNYLHKAPFATDVLSAWLDKTDWLFTNPAPWLLEFPMELWLTAAADGVRPTPRQADPQMNFISNYHFTEPNAFEFFQILSLTYHIARADIKKWLRAIPDMKIPTTYTVDGVAIKVDTAMGDDVVYKLMGPRLAHAWLTTEAGLRNLLTDKTSAREMALKQILATHFADAHIAVAAPQSVSLDTL